MFHEGLSMMQGMRGDDATSGEACHEQIRGEV